MTTILSLDGLPWRLPLAKHGTSTQLNGRAASRSQVPGAVVEKYASNDVWQVQVQIKHKCEVCTQQSRHGACPDAAGFPPTHRMNHLQIRTASRRVTPHALPGLRSPAKRSITALLS